MSSRVYCVAMLRDSAVSSSLSFVCSSTCSTLPMRYGSARVNSVTVKGTVPEMMQRSVPSGTLIIFWMIATRADGVDVVGRWAATRRDL